MEVKIRVLSTSSVDLKTYVSQGLFDKELYEYLSASIIELPPLKERKEEKNDDILLLTGHFLRKYSPSNSPPLNISSEASKILEKYQFPGNVRELEDAIRLAITRAKSGTIETHDLPERIQYWQHSTIVRRPLPKSILCPHGYSLTEQADFTAQLYDTRQYVHLSVGTDDSTWYQSALENILNGCGLKLFNKSSFNSENFCSICQPVLACNLAIFDISTSSPDVFYKLGLAQAMGVPCAILKSKNEQIPKHLGQIRMLEYDDEISLRKSILTWLEDLTSPNKV